MARSRQFQLRYIGTWNAKEDLEYELSADMKGSKYVVIIV